MPYLSDCQIGRASGHDDEGAGQGGDLAAPLGVSRAQRTYAGDMVVLDARVDGRNGCVCVWADTRGQDQRLSLTATQIRAVAEVLVRVDAPSAVSSVLCAPKPVR